MLRPVFALSLFCLLLCTGLAILTLLTLALDGLGMQRLIYPIFGLGLLINFPLSFVLAGRLVERYCRSGPAFYEVADVKPD